MDPGILNPKSILKRKQPLIFAILLSIVLNLPVSTSANGAQVSGGPDKRARLDDPRNPDCPCHKYQEQADKEYAALLNKSKTEGDRDHLAGMNFKKKSTSYRRHPSGRRQKRNGKKKAKRKSTVSCPDWG